MKVKEMYEEHKKKNPNNYVTLIAFYTRLKRMSKKEAINKPSEWLWGPRWIKHKKEHKFYHNYKWEKKVSYHRFMKRILNNWWSMEKAISKDKRKKKKSLAKQK